MVLAFLFAAVAFSRGIAAEDICKVGDWMFTQDGLSALGVCPVPPFHAAWDICDALEGRVPDWIKSVKPDWLE